MNNKIYISGPITGHPDWEERFRTVEYRCCTVGFFDRYGGAALAYKYGEFVFSVVSPRVFNEGVRFRRWWWYMVRSLWRLLFCSHVYMMCGWHESRGARIENRVAQFFGKHIIYEEDARCR